MSLDYEIEFDTEQSPKEVLEQAFLFAGETVTACPMEHDSSVFEAVGSALYLASMNIEPFEVGSSRLGINARIRITISIRVEQWEVLMPTLLRITEQFLINSTVDLTLLSNLESVLLYRKAGKLIRNSRDGVWNEFTLSFLTLDYALEEIPVL